MYKNKTREEYKVVKYSDKRTKSGNKMVTIKFLDNGYEYDIDPVQITRGHVKNRFAKIVYGVGCIGNVKMANHKRAHSIWVKMIQRCYDPTCSNYKNYGAKGVVVDDRWHIFENFIKDVPSIDGYNKEDFNNGVLNLDKDLKHAQGDKKIYSLDKCTWISRSENSKIVDNESKKIEFIAISPSGANIKVKGIKRWCGENNLVYDRVKECLYGSRDSYKGWTFEKIAG